MNDLGIVAGWERPGGWFIFRVQAEEWRQPTSGCGGNGGQETRKKGNFSARPPKRLPLPIVGTFYSAEEAVL